MNTNSLNGDTWAFDTSHHHGVFINGFFTWPTDCELNGVDSEGPAAEKAQNNKIILKQNPMDSF